MRHSSHGSYDSNRPPSGRELDLRLAIADLQREVEAHSRGRCTVRLQRHRGWPLPPPVTEVTVRVDGVTQAAAHADPHTAVTLAFRTMLDRILAGMGGPVALPDFSFVLQRGDATRGTEPHRAARSANRPRLVRGASTR
jgi:hypothetical protein